MALTRATRPRRARTGGYLLVAFAALCAALPAHASSLTRRAHETAESFAKRNGPPQAALAHQVVETRAWGGPSPAIIAFYEREIEQSGETVREVVGYLYVPSGSSAYRRILIGTFEAEGGDPTIEAVFVARAGGGRQPKLMVICSWPQNHYDVHGTLYATFVYGAPRPGSRAARLTLDAGLSKRLDGGCECEWRDGTVRVAKYKTAEDVRAALRAMAR